MTTAVATRHKLKYCARRMMRPDISSRSLPTVHRSRQQHRRAQSDEGIALKGNDIPYRLPKVEQSQSQLTPRSAMSRGKQEPTSQELLYKIDYMGSENIERYRFRRKKPPGPPHTISQQQRQEGIHMPTFKRVNIQPVLPHDKVFKCAEDSVEGRQTTLSTRSTTGLPGIFKSSELIQDTPNAPKQAAWRLSPYQHKNYDVQAIRGQTGPFSRDFIIHCNTPTSWLRMKLKSQNTDH